MQLPLDVPLWPAKAPETDCRRVERMEFGEHVDHGGSECGASGASEKPVGVQFVADYHPIDEVHDVERGTVDIWVRAQRQPTRDRDRSASEGGKDSMFAAHVVGRLENA